MRSGEKITVWVTTLCLLFLFSMSLSLGVEDSKKTIFNANIGVSELSKTAKPCETTSYDIFITNTGNIVDLFSIGVPKDKEYIDVNNMPLRG